VRQVGPYLLQPQTKGWSVRSYERSPRNQALVGGCP